MKNSLTEWRKGFEHDENAPEELLKICGVWGCLHAINVACKIGMNCSYKRYFCSVHAVVIAYSYTIRTISLNGTSTWTQNLVDI